MKERRKLSINLNCFQLKIKIADMYLLTFLPFITALAISTFSIPIIINVARAKHLMDEPDSDRKLHVNKTPTLGGVAIFIGTIFSFASFTDHLSLTYSVKFFIPALLLLFFAGVFDDLMNLRATKKLMVQMFCAILVVFLGSMHLTSLWGMFGIVEIPAFIGMFITFFIIVSLINAYNLIDGINGLAGGLGLIASLFFGFWFAATGSSFLSILSFATAGSILGFLFFNFNKATIFMGDTGSMILGFIISVLAIKFIENNRIQGFESSAFYIKAAPGIAVSVVLIPLFDMSRVFFLRLVNKRNPFSPDRNHIHHMLVDMGLSHVKVCAVLYPFAALLIGISIYFRELRSMQVVLIVSGCMTLFTLAVSSFKKFSKE